MALSSRYVFWSTAAFLFVGLLALLIIVAANLWLNERAQDNFDLAIEARDARAAAGDLRGAVWTAESSQRGFLLTGNEIYLAPYSTARLEAQRQIDALRRLLAPYPQAQNSVERLAELVQGKFAETDETITLKRSRLDDEAIAIVRTNRGKAMMDEASLYLTAIIQQADARLDASVDEQRLNAQLVRTVSALGALVIIVVVGGAAYLLYRYTGELRRAGDEVNAANAALETRVEERTADLVEARDRATLLLSEVNHRIANSLAMVSALVAMQSRAMTDEAAKKALAETQDRIFAVSLVHKRLYSGASVSGVTLDEYLSGLLEHLTTSMRSTAQGVTLVHSIEPIELATDASINLGVVVTEWVTNAFKYAYPGGSGQVRVTLRQLPGGDIELVVEDDGVGRVDGAPAAGTGLGTRIVSAMAQGMSATYSYEPLNPGTRARLVFSPSQRRTAGL
jgi:two-component sensor histidine kinase